MPDTINKKDLLNSTMSLGDHLEELRKRLIYAIVGIAVCAIIGFCFGKKIIRFVEKPYHDAMADNIISADTNEPADEKQAPSDTVMLQTLAPADGFISYVKISFITGLLISSPWVFYHLWMFVAAGLYQNEKRYVYIAAPFSALLFVTGSLFFILMVAPLTLSFLIKFNQHFLGVRSQFTFQNYISFMTHLMLVFGIAFQTPTAIFFLNKAGLVSTKALTKSRKFVLLAVFVVAAMATPPDVVSQITLAVPLYLLFELGILLTYFSKRKKKT